MTRVEYERRLTSRFTLWSLLSHLWRCEFRELDQNWRRTLPNRFLYTKQGGRGRRHERSKMGKGPPTLGGKPMTKILLRKSRPVFGTLSSLDNFVSSRNCNFRLLVIVLVLVWKLTMSTALVLKNAQNEVRVSIENRWKEMTQLWDKETSIVLTTRSVRRIWLIREDWHGKRRSASSQWVPARTLGR